MYSKCFCFFKRFDSDGYTRLDIVGVDDVEGKTQISLLPIFFFFFREKNPKLKSIDAILKEEEDILPLTLHAIESMNGGGKRKYGY